MNTLSEKVRRTAATLLSELVGGAGAEAAWILNPSDPGLLRSLDRLPASAASKAAPGGGPSIAAHVDHLRYGLSLLNGWSRGEDVFSTADYAASWRRTEVSKEEWAELRAALAAESEAWVQAVQRPMALDDVALAGVLGSIAHLAYHLGAIRQIDREARGPAAKD